MKKILSLVITSILIFSTTALGYASYLESATATNLITSDENVIEEAKFINTEDLKSDTDNKFYYSKGVLSKNNIISAKKLTQIENTSRTRNSNLIITDKIDDLILNVESISFKLGESQKTSFKEGEYYNIDEVKNLARITDRTFSDEAQNGKITTRQTTYYSEIEVGSATHYAIKDMWGKVVENTSSEKVQSMLFIISQAGAAFDKNGTRLSKQKPVRIQKTVTSPIIGQGYQMKNTETNGTVFYRDTEVGGILNGTNLQIKTSSGNNWDHRLHLN